MYLFFPHQFYRVFQIVNYVLLYMQIPSGGRACLQLLKAHELAELHHVDLQLGVTPVPDDVCQLWVMDC